jgi:hypothetical protein
LPTTLHVDEAGREDRDADFVVGGALLNKRRPLAARLNRVIAAWPFLDRPLHGAHLRCAGHLATRWWAWSRARDITDPRADLGFFGPLAEDARNMWADEFFDEHLTLQTWAASADVDLAHPALAPAAFFRQVLRAPAPPPDTSDIQVLSRWGRSAGLRGPTTWAFVGRIQDTVLDALTSGGGDLSFVLTRDKPEGATRAERARYLRMLGATLEAGQAMGAQRAHVQRRHILPLDPPGTDEHIPLALEHLAGRDAGLDVTLLAFWRDASPGDEAVDLLLGAARHGGPRSIAPVPVHTMHIGPATVGPA